MFRVRLETLEDQILDLVLATQDETTPVRPEITSDAASVDAFLMWMENRREGRYAIGESFSLMQLKVACDSLVSPYIILSIDEVSDEPS